MKFTQPIPTLCRDGDAIVILDQTQLPFAVVRQRLTGLVDAEHAIAAMQVRGAPLIGITAAYGVALAMQHDASDAGLDTALTRLAATRPTAVNLHWALAAMRAALHELPPAQRPAAAWATAERLRDSDEHTCAEIGRHGAKALLTRFAARPQALRVLTHCNAGWLATLGAGTALAPIYTLHAQGQAVEVLVSETRPRNQGLLTAWELAQAGIPHQLIADNAAGWLIANGHVDVVITGADRIAANGDTANKVGTYLKALAAHAHGVPFFIAAPHSTLDLACAEGAHIPIEERAGDEVREISGVDASGHPARVALVGATTAVVNPAFDVTPAALITGFITESGVLDADALAQLRSSAAPSVCPTP